MTRDPLALAELHCDALYTYDAAGRMLGINEPDPADPAPRFFLFRTPAGAVWRVRDDVPAGTAAALARLTADEPAGANLPHRPVHEAEYAALLAAEAPIAETYCGPAYYLPDRAPSGGATLITRDNMTLLRANFPFTLSSFADLVPIAAVGAEGVAVSVCFCARRTAAAAEAGVNTVESFRGRGYAAAAVAVWAAALRATGRLPLYSTWWENAASQAVAARLGAVGYGVDFSLT